MSVVQISEMSRHPSDVLRIGTGASLVLLATIWAQERAPDRFEADLFRLVNDLPAWCGGLLIGPMQMGALGAAPVVGILVWIRVGRRPALLTASSGLLGWAVARLLKYVVARPRPGLSLPSVIFRGSSPTGLGFPSGHCTVAAAMATVLMPYLPRWARRGVWIAVGLVAIARIFVGAHLPADVLGGIALGLLLGALINVALGTPSPRVPTIVEVRALLGAMLSPGASIERFPSDARGSTPFAITDGEHRWFGKALGREERDADALFKLWRRLVYRGLDDETPFLTARQKVEHEALATLIAEKAGSRCPAFVRTYHAPGLDLLVTERVSGRDLASASPDDLSDQTLDDMWGQVALLHAQRLAHRDLRLANVIVDDDGRCWLIDFGYASLAASNHELERDIVELTTSTALVVGPERAIAAAFECIGLATMTRCSERLQSFALSHATRQALRSQPGLLVELREAIARRSGEAIEPADPPYRIRPRSIILLAAAAIGIHLLLPQVGELRLTLEAMRHARIPLLVLSCVTSFGTYVAATVAQMGALPRPVPTEPLFLSQVAASFANRVSPASLGGSMLNYRFLERRGYTRNEAASAVGLNSIAGLIVHVVLLLAAAGALGRTKLDTLPRPHGWGILIIVIAVSVAAGAVLHSSFGRRRAIPVLRDSLVQARGVLNDPLQAGRLFGGSLAVTITYALTLGFAVDAFGPAVPVAVITAAYLGGAAVGSVSPTPGGLGAEEAALVAALTALGVPAPQAISGVLAFRLATFWLPILPGWWAFRGLRSSGAI